MSDRISTEDAVRIASFMLSKKVSPLIVNKTVMLEGFTANKAGVIVRWAQRRNEELPDLITSEEEFQEIYNHKPKNDVSPAPPMPPDPTEIA